MNFFPPLLGMGIRVREFTPDWTVARVELKLNRLNRNQHGTAFGGSIGAMSDAFYALLLMHQLGRDYYVWDQAAEITYVSPGVGTIFGTFEVPKERTEQIRAEAASGEKVLPWFETELTLRDGTVVARVRRQLYVRRKKSATEAAEPMESTNFEG
ncbi:DUF4442 domain-containing protein [Calidifontibacter sp. DB0510]|uniref:DUF4442 domain-containing protein n=2 Tax=Metallococcus carri TaxID=1656884 RepID=A0A967AWI9_9MICO|nr:DUF4442 domain-containing protein [Metallococcus carri]NOP36914.1 DUF4442 domain-containing protein [Calidifontibacter sp. DB2511S]